MNMSILDNEDILIQAATDSACYEMVDLLNCNLRGKSPIINGEIVQVIGVYSQTIREYDNRWMKSIACTIYHLRRKK